MAYHAVSSDAGSFPCGAIFRARQSMSEVIRDWKRFHKRSNNVGGRKDISIIGCGLMNAALNFQQN